MGSALFLPAIADDRIPLSFLPAVSRGAAQYEGASAVATDQVCERLELVGVAVGSVADLRSPQQELRKIPVQVARDDQVEVAVAIVATKQARTDQPPAWPGQPAGPRPQAQSLGPTGLPPSFSLFALVKCFVQE